jgi:hypothetical protein
MDLPICRVAVADMSEQLSADLWPPRLRQALGDGLGGVTWVHVPDKLEAQLAAGPIDGCMGDIDEVHNVVAVSPGLPLGVNLEFPRPLATMSFPPGSALVVYTDGLIERRGSLSMTVVAARCGAPQGSDKDRERVVADVTGSVGFKGHRRLCLRRWGRSRRGARRDESRVARRGGSRERPRRQPWE